VYPSAAAAGRLPPSPQWYCKKGVHFTTSTEAESTEPRPFGSSAIDYRTAGLHLQSLSAFKHISSNEHTASYLKFEKLPKILVCSFH